MNIDAELHYRPLKVYVIRNKDGAFAPRTKIYPSKSGGTMGFNKFVEAQMNYYYSMSNPVYRAHKDEIDGMMSHWIWGGKKDFNTYDKVRANIQNRYPHICVTRQAYDEFMRVVEKIHDEWSVIEIDQSYA